MLTLAALHQITSRLSTADTLPSSRMLNFGAAYLQQHYSHWVQQQSHAVRVHRSYFDEPADSAKAWRFLWFYRKQKSTAMRKWSDPGAAAPPGGKIQTQGFVIFVKKKY